MNYFSLHLRSRLIKFKRHQNRIIGLKTGANGERFKAHGSSNLAWIENTESSRVVKARDADVKSPRYVRDSAEWYVDQYQDGTTEAVIIRLPHGRCLSAVTNPWQDGPLLVDCSEVYTSENEAVLNACRTAELYAEFLREDDAEQTRLANLENLNAENETAKAEICEVRALMGGVNEIGNWVWQMARDKIAALIGFIRRNNREISKLEN